MAHQDKTPKRVALYIGRFSPFHKGHRFVIKRSLSKYDMVIVLVGSSNVARSIKNPFTYEERRNMIYDAFDAADGDRLLVGALNDVPYDDTRWAVGVANVVDRLLKTTRQHDEVELYLTGADRDDSTFYLKMFPQFKLDLVGITEEDVSQHLSATMIREIYFGKSFDGREVDKKNAEVLLHSFLPASTRKFMHEFEKHKPFEILCEEYQFIQSYKKQWSVAPYAPTFVTVDAVVVQSGHILMIRRRAAPGAGLMALPGGFVNQDERLLDAAIRELREETKLKVPTPVLKGSIVRKEIFDLPERSLRGRTFTIAYFIKLPDGPDLPLVKGSDDAERAMWVPIADVMNSPTEIFEDHHAIIQELVGV